MPSPTPPAAVQTCAVVDSGPADGDTHLHGFRAHTLEIQPQAAWYRVGTVAVAIIMVALPVVYLCIIGATGWGVVWYADYGRRFLSFDYGPAALFFYGIPLLAGSTMVLFMVKPLFAPTPKAPAPLVVCRASEPALWALVEHICRIVGAPPPRSIAVNCEVNASAGFERGWSAFARGHLQLTLGLPLVAGMTRAELVGLLAHEFGHFRQGGAMRMTGLIRRTSFWFHRVVHERDGWDRGLDQLIEKIPDFRLKAPFTLAYAMIWLGRRMLWCLMWIGQIVSSFLLRQMEHDADRVSAHLVGSKTALALRRRVTLLNAAAQRAWDLVHENLQSRRLPEDLPALVAVCARKLSPEAIAALEEADLEQQSGWFDTHPTGRERDTRVRALAVPGIFQLDASAASCFRGLSVLAREASQHHYAILHGIPVDVVAVVANDEIESADGERLRLMDVAIAVSSGLLGFAIPLALDEAPAAANTNTIPNLAPALDAERENVVAFTKAERALASQMVAYNLKGAGYSRLARKIPGVGPVKSTVAMADEIDRRRKLADAARDRLTKVGRFLSQTLDAAVHRRLAAATSETDRHKVRAYWHALRILHGCRDCVRLLQRDVEIYRAILAALRIHRETEMGVQIANTFADSVMNFVGVLQQQLASVPSPFADVPADTPLGQAMILPFDTGLPPLWSVLRSGEHTLRSVHETQLQLAGWILDITPAAQPA